jgi:hypothetical protein
MRLRGTGIFILLFWVATGAAFAIPEPQDKGIIIFDGG